jgi:hypothetical protein
VLRKRLRWTHIQTPGGRQLAAHLCTPTTNIWQPTGQANEIAFLCLDQFGNIGDEDLAPPGDMRIDSQDVRVRHASREDVAQVLLNLFLEVNQPNRDFLAC